jgi:uracil phosphoribosyltransferase
MLYNFSDHKSIVSQFISELRDVKVQTDRMRFRQNMERISSIMAYEISKQLSYKNTEVETPLGIANVDTLQDQVVVASILRAGLPLHQGFLSVFDNAENAFISAYRKHHRDGTFEIKLEYITCPSLEDKVVIIVDPMLATGASLEATMEVIKDYGKTKAIHIATIISSDQGLNHIKRLYPKAHIWVGAVDDELTSKSYIVPGLGDAGDLAFGSKLQE